MRLASKKYTVTVFEKADKSKKDLFFYRGAILPTKYIQEHGALTGADYVEKLRDFDGKILAITGTGDIQASHQALRQLEGLENAQVYAPIGVNHILREIDDNNSMLTYVKQYKRLCKTPLHAPTLNKIQDWLVSNFNLASTNGFEK